MKVAGSLVRVDEVDKVLFDHIYMERCLGPSADPKQEKRLSAALRYIDGLNRSYSSHVPHIFQKKERHKGLLAEVVDDFEAIDELWPGMLMLQREEGNPLPEEVADIERLHLSMTALFFPKTSVGSYGFTLDGAGQFLGGGPLAMSRKRRASIGGSGILQALLRLSAR